MYGDDDVDDGDGGGDGDDGDGGGDGDDGDGDDDGPMVYFTLLLNNFNSNVIKLVYIHL